MYDPTKLHLSEKEELEICFKYHVPCHMVTHAGLLSKSNSSPIARFLK